MRFAHPDLDLDRDDDSGAASAWDLGPELAWEESQLAALDLVPGPRRAHSARAAAPPSPLNRRKRILVSKNPSLDHHAVATVLTVPVDVSANAASTIPVDALSVLRAAAIAAIEARDAIDDCFCPAWAEAHREAVVACHQAVAEMERLAKNPATRYGSWRTPADVELMVLGYL